MSKNKPTGWKDIEDLPVELRQYADEALATLSRIWEDQRGDLEERGVIKPFMEKLRRQWAIETGIIENLYTLDRGITRTLVERGIEASLIPHGGTNKPVEYVVALIRDQERVISGLFDFVGRRRDLTCSYIKEMHAALTQHQAAVEAVNGMGRNVQVELVRGDWKRLPNNPTRGDETVHHYCPPEHVPAEMDRLVAMHKEHSDEHVAPEVEAAWLHHRFTQIHPFQDGNGRVARALATLVFLRAGWFPLVLINDEHRADYIAALERADAGDLQPLIDLFARLEKRALTTAMSLGEEVVREQKTLGAMISAVAESFQARTAQREQSQRAVLALADDLITVATKRLDGLRDQMQGELSSITPVTVSVTQARPDSRKWFWKQVVDVAGALDYFANLRTYHNWVRLKIAEDRQAEIVVSAHPIGRRFSGLMGATAFIEYRDRQEEGPSEVDGPYRLVDQPFYFSYRDEKDNVLTRFDKWLNEVILAGLEQLRLQL